MSAAEVIVQLVARAPGAGAVKVIAEEPQEVVPALALMLPVPDAPTVAVTVIGVREAVDTPTVLDTPVKPAPIVEVTDGQDIVAPRLLRQVTGNWALLPFCTEMVEGTLQDANTGSAKLTLTLPQLVVPTLEVTLPVPLAAEVALTVTGVPVAVIVPTVLVTPVKPVPTL